MKLNVGIVDYGMGNLHSVSKAFQQEGANVCVSESRQRLKRSDLLVLPGVGAFGAAMKTLARKRLDELIYQWLEADKPYVGICLGFQLLFGVSEENPRLKGLNILSGRVVRFREKDLKRSDPIHHMGWNTACPVNKNGKDYFKGIRKNERFYFVHSYYPVPQDEGLALTKTVYGKSFFSSITRGNLFASQFHPEKSGRVGLTLIDNILQKVKGTLCL
ncbi:MAG: imidazole glycerol phosphate synthase subunit HisH [Elusimicrobia bacterium]|nr:imidazole glycerol phosphate synthase subunit HisH [Candidatus Obscuribacterium magneticum]